MTLDRISGAIEHHRFHELPSLLTPGDLLLVNDTRVLPARLFATIAGDARAAAGMAGSTPSPGAAPREVEVLLLREEPAVAPERVWSALARPARALKTGVALAFVDPSYRADVTGWGERGVRHLSFRAARPDAPPFEAWLARVGHVPLPPYIDRPDEPEDRERYQTIFARDPGSVAAPTASLHFARRTLDALRDRGIEIASLTLHVGPGTFRPVATEHPEDHFLDTEPYRVPPETARTIGGARGRNAKVIAVGTTCVRALESWARDGMPEDGAWRDTSLFVLPPFRFQVADGMITNFHLPRSSLLLLISALAGRERVLAAYRVAVREGYRFYSYGDAMLIR
jgi:S-adenosylmethionine:tRNA ribosyltransferase-isomerase